MLLSGVTERHRVSREFFDAVVLQADRLHLLSDEHFTVDGTLIEAAASLKSFRPKNEPPSAEPADDRGNPTVNFRGEKRSNATHQSTTDPEARLAKKGRGFEAKLGFMGHPLMENRHGLLVDFQLTHATGTAERDTVPQLLYDATRRGFHPRTLGADKAYDARECVATIRAHQVTPHLAQNTSRRRSAIDARTTRHPGYALSQRIRKRVEEVFGWLKEVGGFRGTRYRGLARNPVGRRPGGDRLQPGAWHASWTNQPQPDVLIARGGLPLTTSRLNLTTSTAPLVVHCLRHSTTRAAFSPCSSPS